MRPYRGPLREQGVFFAVQSSADCITNMSGFDLRQTHVELDLVVVLAGMQGVEVGDAIHPELAIDDELALPDLPGDLHDPGKAPVVAALGEQPHAVVVALNTKPVAVVFDLVEPIGAVPSRRRFHHCAVSTVLVCGLRPWAPGNSSGCPAWRLRLVAQRSAGPASGAAYPAMRLQRRRSRDLSSRSADAAWRPC